MTFECPQCQSPVSREGQRFCNRCGNDLRSYYESRGISLPSQSAELPAELLPGEGGTLEIEPATNGNAEAVLDPNIVEPDAIHQTIAIAMPDITVETAPAGSAAPQQATLRILLPSSDVFDREVKKVETQIGKGPRNDIVIADPAVSTSHAVIRQENGGYLIKDLGSRNGTLINGRKITASEKLNHGDVIGMGTTKLTFRLSGYSETGIIQAADITAPIPNNRLPLTQESLAVLFVREGVVSQSVVDNLRGTGSKGRRLYRALVEEGLADEQAMRDAMSRAFAIPVTDLAVANVNETLVTKFPAQLARDRWIFPIEETPQRLLLAVADPTDQAAVSEVKAKFYQPVELRLATAKDILDQADKHYGPKLVGVLPTGDKIEYLINRPEIEIGKAPHNQIVLTDPTVSNTHAVIMSRDGGFSIVDLGSRNGTFVNGERLTTHARTLKHGDSVQMGQTLWTFRNPSETPENVTAILSPEALEEIRRRAVGDSPRRTTEPQPVLSVNATPQPSAQQLGGAQPVATPVEVTNIQVPPLGIVGQDGQGLPQSGTDDAATEKKKKKKDKKKGEVERVKAAYIRAVGGILATVLSVILTVLLTIYLSTQMRQQPAAPGNPGSTITEPGNRGTKLRLANATAATPFEGGKYEASGAEQMPGVDGIYFVDNSKSSEIYFMPVDATGKQSGGVQAINFGAAVSDPEGIAYGASFFYVMSSLSFPDLGSQNALVRFAVDPQSRALQGTAEVMTGIRDFLATNVPELQAAASLPYDQGGINIEGIAWDPVHERLLLGLRSPVASGKALLVPLKLKDPRGPFSTANLVAPGPAIQVALGGLGIRDIEYDTRAGVFVIIAGSTAQGEAKEFTLFEWSGETDAAKPDAAPKELAKLDPKMKPEGVTRLRIAGKDFLVVVGDASSFIKFDLVEGQ